MHPAILRMNSLSTLLFSPDSCIALPITVGIQYIMSAANELPGIDVLNTGYGDFELRFDPNSPEDVQKAKETITDMLKRGYAIFVLQGKETFRVRKFDPDKNVYIIGSTPAEEVPITETRATAVGRSAGG
jgi:hypothetical protein